jgi:predicted transposase YbfD/YdcC
MAAASVLPMMRHFTKIEDPRVVGRSHHKLFDISFIGVCGSIAACDDWNTIHLWAKAKRKWLRKYCELPHGIPSADTLRRFFQRVDPEALHMAFIEWMKELHEILDGQSVAIDGKTLRRSFNRADGKGAIHVVSAWMSANRMVLGQVKTEEKSNEITAIPDLLKLLEIKGALVTIDAMGCQKEIVRTIREREADYCLAVKENQPSLMEDIRQAFEEAPDSVKTSHMTQEQGHGRLEIRTYELISDLSGIRSANEWQGLDSVLKVESHRFAPEGNTSEVRYYITSLKKGVRRLAKAVRNHWGIENSLHYVLDVTFKEDWSRVRKDGGAENMSTLRHIAMNFINNAKHMKLSVKNRRMSAAFDNKVLEEILGI